MTKDFLGRDARLFKRHEDFREFAHTVLGVELILTPSSEGVHIRASKHIPDVAVTYNTTCIFVSRCEIDHARIDVLGLNMLQAVKDVGGFSVLH